MEKDELDDIMSHRMSKARIRTNTIMENSIKIEGRSYVIDSGKVYEKLPSSGVLVVVGDEIKEQVLSYGELK